MYPVDWRSIIFDLLRARIRVTQIAKELKVARTTVIRWRDSGGIPLHSHGEKLIALWAKELSKDPAQAPRLSSIYCI